MRISDWSSDVCSSGLLKIGLELACRREGQPQIARRADVEAVLRADIDALRPQLADVAAADVDAHRRIAIEPPGRASRDARAEGAGGVLLNVIRSEEHTPELQSRMRTSDAVLGMEK